MMSNAIESWNKRVNHKNNLVDFLDWNSESSLLARYKAPIFTIGKPRAAHTPAINNNVIGLGRAK